MSNHPTSITKYEGSLSELVEDISNLRYDVLVEFFNMLFLKIALDGYHDIDGGRKQLGKKLMRVATKLKITSEELEEIWQICKKHMKLDD